MGLCNKPLPIEKIYKIITQKNTLIFRVARKAILEMRTYWNTDHFRQSLMVVNLATLGYNSEELKVFFYYFFDSSSDHWTLKDKYSWAKLHVENYRNGNLELDDDEQSR